MMVFRIDDVLQSCLFSTFQKQYFQKQPPFEWFKEAVEIVKDHPVKLAVVAEGINHYPEWVELIQSHPEWEIACHGLEHVIYKKMPEKIITSSLIVARWKLETTFKRVVTEFVPPWMLSHENLTTPLLVSGMELSHQRTSIDDLDKHPEAKEVYFHFWNRRQLGLIKDYVASQKISQ